MLNPTKYIRKGFLDTATSLGVTTPIWEDRVPKNVMPIPNKYILMTNPTLQPVAPSKSGHEWSGTINFDCYSVNPQGYASGAQVDDIAEQVMNIVDSLQIPNFIRPKNVTRLENVTDLPLETETASIQRRILTYRFWLKYI